MWRVVCNWAKETAGRPGGGNLASCKDNVFSWSLTFLPIPLSHDSMRFIQINIVCVFWFPVRIFPTVPGFSNLLCYWKKCVSKKMLILLVFLLNVRHSARQWRWRCGPHHQYGGGDSQVSSVLCAQQGDTATWQQPGIPGKPDTRAGGPLRFEPWKCFRGSCDEYKFR